MNNLDPEVAEHPDDLVVYGGIGRAARNWDCFDAIVAALRALGDDETLLVQSGKPVGVFRTHADAPRVLIANSNLVPHWATWEHFHELDRKGLMMYGQMTAGSWIYIGSQGIVQGTYETFVAMGAPALRRRARGPLDPHRGPRRHGRRAAARRDDGGRLDARGRVRPVAHRHAAAHALPRRAGRHARRGARDDRGATRARPGGLGRAARQRGRRRARAGAPRRAARRRHRPDLARTIRVNGYLPRGLDARAVGSARRQRSGARSSARRAPRWRARRRRCSSSSGSACRSSTTATTSARWRSRRAWRTPSTFPGFVPAYIRPLFCEGIGPVPLGRRSRAIPRTSTAPTRR